MSPVASRARGCHSVVSVREKYKGVGADIARVRRALKRVGDRTDSSRARRSPGRAQSISAAPHPRKPGRSRIPPPGSAPALCESPSSNAGEAGRLPSVASRAVLHVASGTASVRSPKPVTRNNLKVRARRCSPAPRLRRSNLHTNPVERSSRRPSPRLHHPSPCPSPSSAPTPRSCPTACASRKLTTRASSPPSPSRYVPPFPRSTRARLQSDIVTRRALDISIGSSPYRSRRSRRARLDGGSRALCLDRPKPTWRGRSLFCSFFATGFT